MAGAYATSATYHSNGILKSFAYGNGFVHTADQHTNGLPKNYYDVKNGVKALDYYAAYDPNANMTTLRDDQISLYNLALTYDGLNRLDNINDSFMGTGSYNYDTMGNITSYTLGSRNITYQYDSNKRLTGTTGSKSYTFGYDDRGNITSNGDRTFSYNLAQHVTYSPKSGANVSFKYDGQDKRVKKTINGQTNYFMYSASGKLIFQEKESGGIVNHIYLAGRPVAKTGDTSDVGRMHYTPFGEPEDPINVGDEMSYTGHVYDDDLDLVYMQARYYDPVIGRFYSNDPVGYRNIHSFNRYTYAANNPYKYIDPTGMAEVFAEDGTFVEERDPNDDNVYVQTDNGEQSLNTSVGDFHRISSVVYGEGPAAGRTAEESTGIANVINNSGERRDETMLESATGGRFFGDGNEAATDYLNNWTQGGRTEAPAARAGVISVLSGNADPTNGSTMFEGTNLLSSPLSNFTERYVDTGVAHTPTVIGNTTFFQETNP